MITFKEISLMERCSTCGRVLNSDGTCPNAAPDKEGKGKHS